ncbi:hypothetical protein, partial [Neisseria sp. P0009.S007]|uniref:hypothetical protein n=1 Tax=Neisseria sp. P0009.S007 TaxID=3436714 RepID=UPI003F82233B
MFDIRQGDIFFQARNRACFADILLSVTMPLQKEQTHSVINDVRHNRRCRRNAFYRQQGRRHSVFW